MQIFSRLFSIAFVIVSCFISFSSFGQFSHAKIGVNGMTCSACTRSVEISLRKLPFVENVEMSLENTNGNITFRKGVAVDIFGVSKAITDAGFDLRFLIADYNFSTVDFSNSKMVDGVYTFYFLKNKPNSKKVSLRFIGSAFQTKKEFNKYKAEFPLLDFSKKELYYVVSVTND